MLVLVHGPGFENPGSIFFSVYIQLSSAACSDKAEQTRRTEELEMFGSSFVVKRASTLLKEMVHILVLPFTIYLGKVGIVVNTLKMFLKIWSLDYLHENHLGCLL